MPHGPRHQIGGSGAFAMLVGVISDTHDRLPRIDAALALFASKKVEAIIHPGDFVAPFAIGRLLRFSGPIFATYGNNDGERAGLKKGLPQLVDGPLFVALGGRTILVHHFIDWCDQDDIERADVVVTGHTHEVVNRVEDGRLFLNPGECCGWVNGRCTVAILDTQGPWAEICELP
ncbi:MAG: metallophosphoesterase [Planctomycetes bacterium]|nr:metallophosphoesterase [Planctomycetota bacterium]